jgi:hypothetical protein
MNKVVVTRAIVGICHMQVCADKAATTAEIEEIANRENPTGLVSGRWRVVREVDEHWGDMRPVQCAEDPGRMHYMLSC